MNTTDSATLEILIKEAWDRFYPDAESNALNDIAVALKWHQERIEAAYTGIMMLELRKAGFATGDQRLDYHEIAFAFVGSFHEGARCEFDAIDEGKRIHAERKAYYSALQAEIDAEESRWQP